MPRMNATETYEAMHWTTLKKAVEEAGGTWTNKGDAIAFLLSASGDQGNSDQDSQIDVERAFIREGAPAIINGGRLETGDHDITQNPPRTQFSNPEQHDGALLEPGVIQPVADRPLDPEKMAMLKFFNEDVVIRIATTTDKNAEQIFELSVNGRSELFRRGEKKKVKRYFVDRLLRLKQTTYTQREVANDQGERQYVNVPHTTLRYDFSVEEDPNPMGKDWLKHTLAEAA